MMIFENLLDLENCIDIFFETQDHEQPLVMYGSGFALKRILLNFEKREFKIACICDSNKSKQGTYYEGQYEIVSLEESIIRFPNALYIITSPLYFWEIKSDLEARISKDRTCDIDFECGHYFSGKEFKSFFIKNINRFERFYELLSDDLSKLTLYNVVKAHFSGERKDFEAACVCADDWYLFKSLMRGNKDSVYIDCGAYDGDTVALFAKSAPYGYKSIIAFEPDPLIDSKLRDTISENNLENVKIIRKGAYDFEGVLSFTQSGVYSTITNSNKSQQPLIKTIDIDVTTIDFVLNGDFVDIIKMDIEGSEYKALLGARAVIMKHKPRLAICLYHNMDDFIRIQELILSMVPEYKLFLRHHSTSCTDTILYAVL